MVRDSTTGALINQDINGLKEYQDRRKALAAQSNEINNVKSEIQNIKQDMSEIKELMLKLLEKGSNG